MNQANEQVRVLDDAPTVQPAGVSLWALFLDFDGTLVELAARPDSVVVDPDLSRTLVRLSTSLSGALAIVSGRPIAIIDHYLGPHFDVAGLHGAERRIGGVLRPGQTPDRAGLRRALEVFEGLARDEPRLVIEDKQLSVAFHWRLVPALEALALTTVDRALAAAGPAYRIQYGHAVAELVPAHVSKGGAVDEFLTLEPYAGRRPVFFGDDLTDEAAFAAVNRHGGVSVKIGEGPTSAGVRLATPEALRKCLAGWAATGHPLPEQIGQREES
jgi:trehalose 6-phosphate phosphatase